MYRSIPKLPHSDLAGSHIPILWRRIAWFVNFVIAVAVAGETRSLGFSWPITFGVVLVVWIVLPFFISQLCAAFIVIRAGSRTRRADGLPDKFTDAIKGLPPEEQDAMAKRMIDALK